MSGNAMPEMGLALQLTVVGFIALLVGLIVLYHIWMDRRDRRAPDHAPASETIAVGSKSPA